jgi:N-acetylneuraminic acid mutarotase
VIPACVPDGARAALRLPVSVEKSPGSYHLAMHLAPALLAVLLFPTLAAGSTATWERRAPLPIARGEVAAARVGSEIFVIGGFTADGQNSPRVDAYSPEGNSWRRAPDLPVSVDHTMSAGYRGKLYVAGGYAADRSRLTTLFSFSNGTWTRLPAMPGERAAAGAAIVRGKLYVVGGVTAGSSGRALARTALVYDIARGRWSSIPGPTPREHLGVATLGGRIYAVGGRLAGADTNLRLLEVYAPGAKRWRRLNPVPGRRGGTGAAGVGRWLVSAGGETPSVTIRTVYRYDVRRGRWSRLPNLPTPRHGLGVVAFGRKVYVIGGGTTPGLAVSSANESLTIR